MKKLALIFLVLSLCISNIGLAQAPQGGDIGGDDSYLSPQKHTIAAVEVRGVPYYDHDAIRLISGLTPGKEIFIPGQEITNAIQQLWEQELFSNVEIGYSKIDPNPNTQPGTDPDPDPDIDSDPDPYYVITRSHDPDPDIDHVIV